MTQLLLETFSEGTCLAKSSSAAGQAVIDMLEAHEFPVARTISKIVPLAEAGEALREWSAAPSRFSKILIQVTE